jgi:UDP-N-acetylglucosamine:LPS N-acetylglucosamine transferase
MRKNKILAISSGGGHWVQLLRLRPAFVGCDVVYATVKEGYREEVAGEQFRVVPDSNQWCKFALLVTAWAVLKLLLRERPDVVISTGAAPGYFALRIGRLLGSRTIWVDSVANAEQLSLSGQKAGHCADLWLTQWPNLAKHGDEGPHYIGNVF